MVLSSLIKKLRSTISGNHRRVWDNTEPQKFLDSRQILSLTLFISFAILVIFICFIGLSPAGPQILPEQIARIRIVAETTFSYESDIRTQSIISNRRRRVPPIYRLDPMPYENFSVYIETLITGLNELNRKIIDLTLAEKNGAIDIFTQEFDPQAQGPYHLYSEDLSIILTELNDTQRGIVFEEGLKIMQNIFREGIYDAEHSEIKLQTGRLSFFNIQKETGHTAQVEMQSEEDALRSLRINLLALDITREASAALYRLLRNGLGPNLVYDPEKSEERIQQVIAGVGSVIISVEEGETIIEPGSKVMPIDIEKLNAYRKSIHKTMDTGFSFNSLLWERILMTCAVLLSSIICIKVRSRQLSKHNRALTLSLVVILLNLAIIRLVIEFGEIGILSQSSNTLTAILPYLAPTSLGPIIVAILIGSGPGIFVALEISIFNALMHGNSLPLLLITFLSSIVGIYYCRNIQLRARVVRAGAYTGLCLALCTFFLGIRDALDIFVIAKQMMAAQLIGIVSGVIALGFLPILEQIFKYTTSISLLELTDFNHPLLRRMQVLTPGSYHHSLMVANLAENGAAAIGANPLICRVCSLFHDIGKTVKPQYFTENQREGINPHLVQNPSMSALVIKSHVKEGVQLAQQHKLPKLIIDVIRQHHGTSLIQYFYYMALKKQKDLTPAIFPNAPKVKLDKVNESTYRYEGPKPQFKESAIILLADSIEAASRSLRKISPQAVDDLIENICKDRIENRQLSGCPLTFEEVNSLKSSFSFTILNMLHTRVDYPKKENQLEVKTLPEKGPITSNVSQEISSPDVSIEEKATQRTGH